MRTRFICASRLLHEESRYGLLASLFVQRMPASLLSEVQGVANYGIQPRLQRTRSQAS